MNGSPTCRRWIAKNMQGVQDNLSQDVNTLHVEVVSQGKLKRETIKEQKPGLNKEKGIEAIL